MLAGSVAGVRSLPMPHAPCPMSDTHTTCGLPAVAVPVGLFMTFVLVSVTLMVTLWVKSRLAAARHEQERVAKEEELMRRAKEQNAQ